MPLRIELVSSTIVSNFSARKRLNTGHTPLVGHFRRMVIGDLAIEPRRASQHVGHVWPHDAHDLGAGEVSPETRKVGVAITTSPIQLGTNMPIFNAATLRATTARFSQRERAEYANPRIARTAVGKLAQFGESNLRQGSRQIWTYAAATWRTAVFDPLLSMHRRG